MDTMEAQIPMWKLMLDMLAQMNDHIQSINLAGIFLSFGLLFLFLFVVGVYAKLDDRISKLEEKDKEL